LFFHFKKEKWFDKDNKTKWKAVEKIKWNNIVSYYEKYKTSESQKTVKQALRKYFTINNKFSKEKFE